MNRGVAAARSAAVSPTLAVIFLVARPFYMQQFGCSTLSLRIQGFSCLLSVFLNSASKSWLNRGVAAARSAAVSRRLDVLFVVALLFACSNLVLAPSVCKLAPLLRTSHFHISPAPLVCTSPLHLLFAALSRPLTCSFHLHLSIAHAACTSPLHISLAHQAFTSCLHLSFAHTCGFRLHSSLASLMCTCNCCASN